MTRQDIYTVGGPVQAGGGVYITRRADEELFRLCQGASFAYILTARQMGKSSLMVRTAERLVEAGVRPVVVDLTQIGVQQISAEEWYFGFLTAISNEFGLETDLESWWHSHSRLGATQRMLTFFEKVLLAGCPDRVVLFVDEIDSTLSLSFTDDFYAAIRSVYNARAMKSAYRRLSFVLVGVATPSDLIRDPHRTPFNLGYRVELTDFTFEEALPLARGLGLNPDRERQVLGWVLAWTGGHPYLTQRLCRVLSDQGRAEWTAADIDEVVAQTFFRERSIQDHNLRFVRDMLTRQARDPAEVLQTYWEVRRGDRVRDDEQSVVKSHLKLSGVVRRTEGCLAVRNALYAEVFDLDWIQRQAGGEGRAVAEPTPVEEITPPRETPSRSSRTTVFVSGTMRDLPEHRRQVLDACLRVGMFPLAMEHMPSSDSDAIAITLRLVDEADLYIAIIGHHYGYVPDDPIINPNRWSITEHEYRRAMQRGMPVLVYLMHDDHPVTRKDIESSEEARRKLDLLKDELKTKHICGFFRSADELRALVIQSLSEVRQRDVTALHYLSGIPAPPEPYAAHPYSLLQTRGLVGRRDEMDILTAWLADPASASVANPVCCVVGLGGTGKSALAWSLFNDNAATTLRPLAGRLWWSFYEADATFDAFVIRALAYVTSQLPEEVKVLPPSEREAKLLTILDREPFLLVLDGLERALTAYARLDVADRKHDDPTANLRTTANPAAGALLRRLTRLRGSRILITTRLFPRDLESATRQPIPGCLTLFLTGLSDSDALALWHSCGVDGSSEALLPLFHSFGSHALLIQTLAGEVAAYRKAPGDFNRWLQDHPDFDPFQLPVVSIKSHILTFALRGLCSADQAVLHMVSAFRLPIAFDTLAALLVGEGKALADIHALDASLTALEERGLLGWERRSNRYSLHPVVHGVVWSKLDDQVKNDHFARLAQHFEMLPQPLVPGKALGLEDLAPAIELYHALVELGRWDDACQVFRDYLSEPLISRLVGPRVAVDLLEMLFPDGTKAAPRLSQPHDQAFVLEALSEARRADSSSHRTGD